MMRRAAGMSLPGAGRRDAAEPARGEKGAVLGLDLERQLHAMFTLAERPADHRFTLTLTGRMTAYSWASRAVRGSCEDHRPLTGIQKLIMVCIQKGRRYVSLV